MKIFTRKKLINAGIVTAGIIVLFLLADLLFPIRPEVRYSTVITAADRSIIHAYLSYDDKWRMRAELSEISPELKKAILYKEDQYFYYHPGVNLISVFRAAFNNTLSNRKTSGASTITMQVVRLLEKRERSYFSKIIEMFRAFQLELHYSKDEILTFYLNLVPYGGNIEGVKAASVLFFGKTPDHLSLAEAVALTIVPNRPTSLRLGRDNYKLQDERNRWIKRYQEEKVFDSLQTHTALTEPLMAKRVPAPNHAPHFANYLKKKYPLNDNVHTVLDLKIQQKAEVIGYNYVNRLHLKNIHNASILIIENKTNKVVGYLGSTDFKDGEHGGQVDGVRAIRSPGSTLKPLVYAMGFDAGLITPKSVMLDVPMNFDGFTPENFDRHFHGPVTVEKALAYSLNIPAVKMLQDLKVETMVDKLKKAGFKQIGKDQNKLGFSLILGGCGVTLEELGRLFTIFPKAGKLEPLKYLESDSLSNPVEIVTPSSAFMVNQILTQITRPDLPNNFQNSYHVPKVAWKTGTSYGRKDAWSIGYNKRYTIAVWVGNFNGVGVQELTGADIATPLLFELFNALDYNSPDEWFSKPEALKVRLVCPETGLMPGENCEHFIADYFIPGVSNVLPCNHQKQVFVSIDEKTSFCSHCIPQGGYKKKLFPDYPAALVDYYRMSGIGFKSPPEHNLYCDRVFKDNPPQITSPINSQEYMTEKDDPAEIMLKCNSSAEVRRVFWYINDRFYKATGPSEAVFFKPTTAKVKISCCDDKGRTSHSSITIKYF